MEKIATHDSATGEKGKGILSWLITPFAKTQSKTIKEQYESGCRMFDLRVRKKFGEWRCAHGVWVSKRTASDILSEINSFPEQCYVALTYEGDDSEVYEFSEYFKQCEMQFKNIFWGGVGIKYGKGSNLFKVKFDYIYPYPKNWPGSIQGFLPLDGKTWHIILPIPWLWKKIYNDKPKFNEKIYVYVDFL